MPNTLNRVPADGNGSTFGPFYGPCHSVDSTPRRDALVPATSAAVSVSASPSTHGSGDPPGFFDFPDIAPLPLPRAGEQLPPPGAFLSSLDRIPDPSSQELCDSSRSTGDHHTHPSARSFHARPSNPESPLEMPVFRPQPSAPHLAVAHQYAQDAAAHDHVVGPHELGHALYAPHDAPAAMRTSEHTSGRLPGSIPQLPPAAPQLTSSLQDFREPIVARALTYAAAYPRLLSLSEHCPSELRSDAVWSLNTFASTNILAHGTSSEIHSARHRRSGRPVVLKVYYKAALTYTRESQVRREVAIHSRLKHPHIIALWGVFEDEAHIVFILEHAAQGDLFSFVNSEHRHSERVVADTIVHPLLSALQYLHRERVLHRDVKLENIFLAHDGTLKLGDFGAAIDTEEEPPIQCAGTLECMSPEVLCCSLLLSGRDGEDVSESSKRRLAHNVYDGRVDTWAVGVLVYEVLTRGTPFGQASPQATVRAILAEDVSLPASGRFSPAVHDFVQRCLCKRGAMRPSAADLLSHPWLRTEELPPRPRSKRRLFDESGRPFGC